MVGLLAGLRDAERTGVGPRRRHQPVRQRPRDAVYPATWFLSSGFESRRRPLSAHPSVVPFQFFATADGHIAIACPKEKFFTALVRVMGLPELATDERFASFAARGKHRDEVVDRLSGGSRS